MPLAYRTLIEKNHTMNHSFTAFERSIGRCMTLIALIFIAGCQKENLLSSRTPNPPTGNATPSPYSLNPRPVVLSAHCKGYYEYLPEGYLTDAPGSRYPLLIFIHGGGEIGQDSSSLVYLLKNGPLKLAFAGTFPTSFAVNGQTYKFIIIAPQFTTLDNPYPDEIDRIIEYARQNYKVNASRIYLTGLSSGAGLCWNYVGNNSSYAKKIAAMVPIAAYINETRSEFTVDAAKAHNIASSNVAIWSTHNNNDPTCPLSWISNAYTLLKNSNPAPDPLPKLTVFNSGIHEGWTQTYDPSFKENNLNIYQWMLQYHR
jgi:predicted peptidase